MGWLVLLDQLVHRDFMRRLGCLYLTGYRRFGGHKEPRQTLVLFLLCDELL